MSNSEHNPDLKEIDQLREAAKEISKRSDAIEEIKRIHEAAQAASAVPSFAVRASIAGLSVLDSMEPARVQQKSYAFERVENAEDLAARLNDFIRKFDASLDRASEVGAQIASFGPQVIHLRRVEHSGTVLIRIVGELDSGDTADLIQHVSQINILLVKIARREPDKEKTIFGFHGSIPSQRSSEPRDQMQSGNRESTVV